MIDQSSLDDCSMAAMPSWPPTLLHRTP